MYIEFLRSPSCHSEKPNKTVIPLGRLKKKEKAQIAISMKGMKKVSLKLQLTKNIIGRYYEWH